MENIYTRQFIRKIFLFLVRWGVFRDTYHKMNWFQKLLFYIIILLSTYHHIYYNFRESLPNQVLGLFYLLICFQCQIFVTSFLVSTTLQIRSSEYFSYLYILIYLSQLTDIIFFCRLQYILGKTQNMWIFIFIWILLLKFHNIG